MRMKAILFSDFFWASFGVALVEKASNSSSNLNGSPQTHVIEVTTGIPSGLCRRVLATYRLLVILRTQSLNIWRRPVASYIIVFETDSYF